MTEPHVSFHAYLASLQELELKQWIRAFLRYGHVEPIVLNVGDHQPADVFADEIWDTLALAEEERQITRQQREALTDSIRAAVGALIRDWTPPVDPPSYFRQLITLAGYLNCRDCYDLLVEVALSGELEGIGIQDKGIGIKDGFDLQRELLRVIFGMRHSRTKQRTTQLNTLLRRYTDHPAYSALCFRKYWMMDPGNGIRYLRRYLKSTLKQPLLPVTDTLLRFHASTGLAFFQEHFEAIRGSLVSALEDTASYVDDLALYTRYVEALRRFCIMKCVFEDRQVYEPELSPFLRKLLDVPQPGKPGFNITWLPPLASPPQGTFVPGSPTLADYIVLGASFEDVLTEPRSAVTDRELQRVVGDGGCP